VANGETGDASSILTLGPQIGYFVTDGLEIGFNPGVSILPGMTVLTPSEGDAITVLQLFATLGYNLHSSGSPVYPFVEVPLGYTSASSGDETDSGFSWGVRAGIKVVAISNFLVTVSGQYYMLSFTPENADERIGLNIFSFGVGVGGFF
jgi:hypothetical protein